MTSNKDKEEELEDETPDLPHAEAITKYVGAAEIVNKALVEVIKACVVDKSIVELCTLGDKIINEECAKRYNKAKTKVEKGIAFPTCISVNEYLGHFSPLADDTSVLKDGDVVKIDLAAHLDGFIAAAAHTLVVKTDVATPTTGRKADVICAAHYAAEVVHRMVKPGNKNTDVTAEIAKVAAIFNCQPMEGVLSHQIKRFIIDGNKVILNKSTLEHRVEEFEFEENQAYSLDIVISTGEGKSKEAEEKTTIFKRAVDQNYSLKLKASRYVFGEINNRFPTLPFNLRFFEEKRAKLGIVECLNHGLVQPYPVLIEKSNEFVAQFKFTVLLLPSGTKRITVSQPLPYVSSEFKITDPDLLKLLETPTTKAKKKKPAKKAAPTTSDAADKMDTQ